VIKEDIDNNSRADVTQRGLMELNNTAIVMTYKGELANDFSILNDYNIVVITEIINLEIAETLNQYCRNKKIGFIYTAEFGLSSFLFSDFGEDFIVEDLTGLECKKYYIKSITNGCPGVVELIQLKK
jgi:molybdopterin/thiamine biosynthesis adenylyltransferase